jgi:hypothetical protein
MNTKLIGAATAIALLAAAPSATAAIVEVTYVGTITTGYDTSGVFGAANTSLVGDSYRVNYFFDTQKTGVLYASSSPTLNSIYGGTFYGGFSSPSLGATVTINGKSASIGGSFFGETAGYITGTSSQQYQRAQDSFTTYSLSSVINPSGTLPLRTDQPFSYAVQHGDTSYTFLQFDTGAQIASADGPVALVTETVFGAAGPTPGSGLASLVALALAGLLARGRRSAPGAR